MALSKIQPASMDLTDNYAFTGTNSISGAGDIEQTKLATLTASSSSTLSFTSSIDNTYNIYKFRFVNIHGSNDADGFNFNCSVDSGSNYNVTKTTTVFQVEHREDNSDTGFAYQTGHDIAQGTGFQRIAQNTGNANDESIAGELWLFDPSSTTFVKHFMIKTMHNTNHDRARQFYVAGYFNSTSAIDAIQFKMENGNIDSGTIEMYGIN
tara:strand:- start:91 stop:717 length:627 start_codon:yes stop_codon:yes gene_type:complete